MGSAGSFDVAYHRYGSLVETADKEQTFFDGVDVSMEGIATLASSDRGSLRKALKGIDARVWRAAKAFSADAPERCAPELRKD